MHTWLTLYPPFRDAQDLKKSLRGLQAFKDAAVPEDAVDRVGKRKVPELPRASLVLQKTIGTGAFGEVCSGCSVLPAASMHLCVYCCW